MLYYSLVAFLFLFFFLPFCLLELECYVNPNLQSIFDLKMQQQQQQQQQRAKVKLKAESN
jgi:hypothetical protein